MEDNLNNIADQIYNLAQPHAYDWWTFGVSVTSIIVAVVAAVLTYKIYKRQLALMQEQSAISKTQTEIAVKQTEIMEQQNKITLFDKRYDVYLKIIKFILLGDAIEMAIIEKRKYGKAVELSMKDPLKYGKGTHNSVKRNTYALINLDQEPIQSQAEFKDNFWLTMEDYIREFNNLSEMITFLFNDEVGASFKLLLATYRNFICNLDKLTVAEIESSSAQFEIFKTKDLSYIKSQLKL